MYQIIKRILDFFVSAAILAVISPIFLILMMLLWIKNKGYPFFFHERAGKNDVPFTMIKFKTMTDEKDIKGNLLPDKDRITPVGNFVRSNSLDELPQLINVLFGKMSLVGPRPLPMKYVSRYNARQALRHKVRPGITGWAQVNGRNTIDWSKKFEYDVQYVENASFLFDIRILLITVGKVLKREGINASEQSTMEEFKGTE